MADMIDFVLGAGQGGCRIAKVFSEEFEVRSAYLNMAKVDFSQLGVSKDASLLLDEGGTGRDPSVGEKIARRYHKRIIEFMENENIEEKSNVIFTVGGGGGSGAGLMNTLLDFLLRLHCNILLIYTLPEKREGLPSKPNALNSLNKVIQKYIIPKKITAMIVDNDFCVKRFGNNNKDTETQGYWNDVNMGIVRGLMRFWYLTNFEQFTNFVDVNAGYGALDGRELNRILYHKGGFLDLRAFSCSSLDIEVAKQARFQSKIFGNLDIGTTKQYIVTIGFPYKMKTDKRVPAFMNAIFSKLERVTKTSFVLRSSHFNKKLTKIRVNVLLSGLIQSHGLKKIIHQTALDIDKYRNLAGVEVLDLSEFGGENGG